MHYMNPFDFVPLPPGGPKALPKDLLDERRLEGRITYRIQTLTPLHITGRTTKSGKHFHTQYFNEAYGRKVIPGASVRGMLSAFIEALTGSDMRSFTRGNESGRPYAKSRGRHVGFLMASPGDGVEGKTEKDTYTHRGQKKTRPLYERHDTMPRGFGRRKIEDAARCLFGYVAQEKRDGDENGAAEIAVGGRLAFEDIPLPAEMETVFSKAWDLDSDAIMGGPNPRANTAWYFTPGGPRMRSTAEGHRVWEILADEVRGRKFYFHQRPEPCHAQYAEWKRWMKAMVEYQVEAIPAGATIGGGRIDFTDLPESLLTLLAYAVALEPGMAHKLGGRKPYGFGSVALAIDGLDYRYMDEPLQPIKPEGLRGRLDTKLLDLGAYKRLKRILHFPQRGEEGDYLFVYPPFNPRGKDPEQRGFATVERAVGDPPKPGNSQKITMYFDHYQKTAVNYKKVMGG